MSGATALTKINKRVKQLQKKHPNAKRTTLQKQAGREYRNGTMPKPRKKAAKAKPRKRAKAKVSGKRKYKVTHRVKRIAKVGTVKRHRKRAKPRPKAHRPRRVGASGKSMVPLLLGVAALGVVGYMLLKPKTPTLPVALAPSTNVARNAAASNVLAYAQAAGAGISALTALINALNGMSDSAVVTASSQIKAGTPIDVAVPNGGPGIDAGSLVYDDNTNYATF